MARKNILQFNDEDVTNIGANTIINGDISGNETFMIEGKVNGNITITGDIYIMESATVSGHIIADNIYLSGKVDGNIKSNGLLKIDSSANLTGNIQVNSFFIEEGSKFNGICFTSTSELNSEKPAPQIKKPLNKPIKQVAPEVTSNKNFKNTKSIINTYSAANNKNSNPSDFDYFEPENIKSTEKTPDTPFNMNTINTKISKINTNIKNLLKNKAKSSDDNKKS